MSKPNLIDKVFKLLLKGKTETEIAKELDRKETTIKKYINQILDANGVKTRENLYAKILGEIKNAGGI